MNFSHHGPANAGGPIGRFSKDVLLFPHVAGAFSFYTSRCLQIVGGMDTGFKNAWEHVEHTVRIIEAGLTTPFYQFADLETSHWFLAEIPGSIEGSSICSREDWQPNIQAGLEYWKTKLKTPCPI
jgi:hypothetical protein